MGNTAFGESIGYVFHVFGAPLGKSQNLPSGYLTVCHGKSPFLIAKPSISMGHFHPFSMAMLVITRGYLESS